MFDPRDTNGIVSEEDTVVLADVGLGELIWTTLFIFMLVMFLWVFILAVRHLFRDRELSGWAKAGWLVGLNLFPLIGSLVYLVVVERAEQAELPLWLTKRGVLVRAAKS
jgi:uncharacterized membrane protein YhaH (DUF805 family)